MTSIFIFILDILLMNHQSDQPFVLFSNEIYIIYKKYTIATPEELFKIFNTT